MLFIPASTAPILRRNRRRHQTSSHAAASDATAATLAPSNTTSTVTNPAPAAASGVAGSSTAHPYAEPCRNYYELFPEEVGAVGNVEVYDAAEAHRWALVGRVVSEADALAQGGCVKVMLDGSEAPIYYNITDSDDVVYGRASYLSAAAPVVSTMVPCALKEEPSVFTEPCTPCCTEEADSESCSTCGSPSCCATSTHCVYPASCRC